MAVKEWVSETSPDYRKIMLFNDPKKPLMQTQPGSKIDCYIDEAYAYLTKKGDLVVAIVPKVQFATNMVDHPMLAGEYVVNNITAVDKASDPRMYLIDHRNQVSLDTLNHIIDLNRPDVLDPQTIFENEMNFKAVVSTWHDHNWVNDALYDQVMKLPKGAADAVPDAVVDGVMSHAGFKRVLSDWRNDNWISANQAKQYARTGKPLKTIDDELAFKVAIQSVAPNAN